MPDSPARMRQGMLGPVRKPAAASRVADSTKRNTARCALSIVAVALLWLTSLSGILHALQNGGLLSAPAMPIVVQKATVLLNETLRLRSEYADCVDDSLVLCNMTMGATLTAERDRASGAQARNRELASDAESLRTRCAATRARAGDAVSAWRAAAAVPTRPYAFGCNATEQTRLKAATGGLDEELANSHAASMVYTNRSKGTVALLVEQIAARAAYDSEYLYNKTIAQERLRQIRLGIVANFTLRLRLPGPDMSQLLACATLSPGHRCPGESLRQLLNASQQRLFASYMGSVGTWGDSVARVDLFVDAAHDRLSDAAAALDAVAAWFDENMPEFNGALPGGIPFPSLYLGRFGLDLGDIPLILPPEALDTIYSRMSAVVETYEEKVASARSGLNADGALLEENLRILGMQEYFDDYNPPPINALLIQKLHEHNSDEFESQSTASAKVIESSSADRGGETILSGGVETVSKIPGTANATLARWLRHARDLTFFRSAELFDPGIDFAFLSAKASLLRRVLVGFDYAYRAILTLAWIMQFWGRSASPMHALDMTEPGGDKGDAHQARSQLQFTSAVLTHPLSLATLWMAAAVVSGSIAWGVYEPWLTHYRTACTATAYDASGRLVSVGSGGTALATNAYALAFNHATMLGNEARMRGLDRYDEAADAVCSSTAPASQREHEATVSRIQSAIDEHCAIAAEVTLMRTCYDVERIDAELTLHGASDGVFLLSQALSEPACYQAISNESIARGAFDCGAALPACVIRCDDLSDEQGRDTSRLSAVAIEAACTAEWLFHSWLLQLLACTALYVLLNAGRLLLVWGLVRLLWESLNTELFPFMATCDAAGFSMYDPAILSAKLQVVTAAFRWEGSAMLLASVLIQIPWIAGLAWAVPGLTYSGLRAIVP